MPRGIQLKWQASLQGCRLELFGFAHGKAFACNDKGSSKLQLHPAECSTAQRGKAKNLRVMLVRQIVDSAEDRQVRVHLVFHCNIDEAVIFDIEIRSAEIQFFTRVHEFCLCRSPESLPPKIRS